MRGVAVAWAENGCHWETGNAIKDKKRMVHVLPEITMEKAELLRTMSWVVGGVDINNDNIALARMELQVKLYKFFGEAANIFLSRPIFEATKSWL